MSLTTQADAYLRLRLLLLVFIFSIQVIIVYSHVCGDSVRSDVQEEGKTRIFVLECKK